VIALINDAHQNGHWTTTGNDKEDRVQKKIRIASILFLLLMIHSSCNDGRTVTDAGSGQAVLRILLTDATADYDSVVIRFSQISAHLDSTWLTITGNTQTVDLLEWSNGRTLVMGSADVPAGYYSQIRLKIDDAYIGYKGKVFPMDVPSGARTGLKFGPGFTVAEGSVYELVFDFDASRSVVTNGPPSEPKGFKLKPHIRLTTTAVSGSITGSVTPPDSLPEAYAIQNGDTISTAFIEPANGFFRLSFLPSGSYMVSIEDTSGNHFNQTGVEVTAGVETKLGDITLTK
jgi:hypothetical protein